MAGPWAYIESPLSIEPLATLQPACAGAPDRASRGTGQMSGALWPSTCVSIKRRPFVHNGREPLPSRYARTGQNSVHSSRHRTNVRCVSSSRTELNREHPSTGQTGTGQTPCPVLCPVRSAQRQTARVSHRTEKTWHRACPVRSSRLCPVLRTALSRSPESNSSPDKSHRTKPLCPVLCPVLLRALFSAPFSTLAYHHQHQSVPSPCARVLVFSQAFSQGC